MNPVPILLLFTFFLSTLSYSDGNEKAQKKKILPKDPLFMTDADVERLYDQWEDTDDEKLPPDELEPHKRPTPKIDPQLMAGLNSDPERILQQSKRGQTVMAFVKLVGTPTRRETEELTLRWQTGLQNNHVKVQRFIIEDHRAVFVFDDGSQAFEHKDFLLGQPELDEFTIDGRSWYGNGHKTKTDKEDKKIHKEL